MLAIDCRYFRPCYTVPMKIIADVRRMIDREWIKVDWAGGQTLTHRLIAAAPLAVALLVSILLPRGFGIVAGGVGLFATVVITIWIEGRRMAGTGAFSTRRSDKIAKRMRRPRDRSADPQREGRS